MYTFCESIILLFSFSLRLFLLALRVRGHINPYEHRTTSYLAISQVFSRAVLGN